MIVIGGSASPVPSPHGERVRVKGRAKTPSPGPAGRPLPEGRGLLISGELMLERYFQLNAHGTTVRTEVVAGCTTFLTMAYIIFVNPLILGDAGMDRGAVFVATCIGTAIGTLVMGLYANYPLALAPGMGLNAYFTYGVVKG